MNQIFLGQRAYGFAAASEIYFGKPVKDLTRRRSRDAGRAAGGAVGLQPDRQPEARHAAPAVHPRPHARRGLHHRGAVRRGARPGAALQGPERGAGACRVRGRDGAPAGVRAVRRRGLLARPGRVPDDRLRRPGGGLSRAAPRAAGLRAAPVLSRPRGLCRPAGATRPDRHAHRRGAGRASRQRRTARRRGARGLAAQGGGGAAERARPSPSPATGSSR